MGSVPAGLKDDREDWNSVHLAVGLLLGVAHKYGVLDVTIYYDDIRVQITPGVTKKTETVEEAGNGEANGK